MASERDGGAVFGPMDGSGGAMRVACAGIDMDANLGLIIRMFCSVSDSPLKMSSAGCAPRLSAGL